MPSQPEPPPPRRSRPDPALRVLGPIELVTGGLGSARLRRAAAVFTIHAGAVLSADRLVDLIWDHNPPANPEAALHTVISRLRGQLVTAGLVNRLLTRPPGYLLRLSPGDCDAQLFTDLVDRATDRLTVDPVGADDLAAAALELWRGPAYAELADLPVAAVEAARLVEYRSRAVELRTQAALALHRPDRALVLAEQEIGGAPLREGPRRWQMLALYRLGRHPDALAAFTGFRRTLDDELGLEPSVDLLELQQRILRHDPALDAPGQPPPPAAVATAGSVPGLPAPRDLIGREGAISVLTGLLSGSRVVTVCGPGGVGKTRLAAAVAHRSAAAGRFPHGARLVELAAVAPGDPVAEAVATALAVVPTSGLTARDRLAQYLAPLTTLLVLDNCEHLVDDVAALVGALVDRCPGLTVLATSQVPLGIPHEQVLPLDPLPVTTKGSEPAAAIRLFLTRAHRADPRFDPDEADLTAIAEVCRRLDGLPLAIELAAGRIRHRTPQELLERMDDRFGLLRGGDRLAPERHASLADVVAWSYGLLDARARDLFDRISVFRGGFSVAEAALVAERPAGQVSHDLGELVDRSLLSSTRDPDRRTTVFVQLETLRAYGADRLVRSGRADAMAGRHARAMLALVGAGPTAIAGDDLGDWVDRVGRQFDDLRAAHTWSRAHDPEASLQLLAGLVDWLECRPTGELIDWADAATADPSLWADDAQLRRLAVVVMSLAAAGERFKGDLPGAVARSEAAVGLLAEPTDPVARYPLYLLAETSLYRGDLARTIEMAGRARVLAEAAGDVLRARWCDMNEILAHAYGGHRDEALAEAEALLARGDLTPIARAWSRYTLGEVLMDLDPTRAATLLERAVADARQLSDRFLTGVALLSLASVTARHEDPGRAVPLLAEVIEHWHRLGNWTQRWTTFRTVAEVLARVGDPEDAAVLLGACRRETAPAPAYGPDAQRLDELADRLRTRLGGARVDRLARRGAELTADEVVTLVRGALARAVRPDQAGSTGSTGSSR
ncbi:MAG TPA: BTAD domain-containing putative transcriptional regulator [Nakamurella sp.]